MTALKRRLQKYIDEKFVQLQRQLDERFEDITMVPLSDGTMSLYADDLMLYRPIYSATDYHFLQMDMDKLGVWSDNNLLKFNGRKLNIIL